MKSLVLFLVLLCAVGASAASLDVDAALRLDADLVIHPSQVLSAVAMPQDSFRLSALKLEKPYRLNLSEVEAVGPWSLQVSPGDLEIGFSFAWENPVVKIGSLAIHDTVSRVVGGVPININLDGVCDGVELRLPNAAWQVSGRLRWDLVAGRLVPQWTAFEFLGAQNISSEVLVGTCSGPSVILSSVRELLAKAGNDRAWFEPLLKQALLEIAQSRLNDLTARLLSRREFSVVDPMVGAWVPTRLSEFSDGRLRVEGEIVLSVPGSDIGADHVERGYTAIETQESGFALPKNAMEHVLRFMHANGMLQYRLSSNDVSAFRSLMANRLAQFFVWPDLMSFARDSQFYFYLSAGAAPQFRDGQISFPLNVQQWAPVANGSYVPYLNFQTQINGQLTATVSDNNLVLRLQPYDLNLHANFAREYQAYRRVNTRLSVGLIGSNVRDYLSEKSFEFALPVIPLTQSLNISLRDIQMKREYLYLPLLVAP